ncbi:MAG: Mur ligase family protein, partial [Bacteroidota bacterium]
MIKIIRFFDLFRFLEFTLPDQISFIKLAISKNLMNLSQLRYIYFVGIGGIGMSALARWFNRHQYEVAGYDRQVSPLTRKLEEEGISIHYEANLDLLPPAFLSTDPQVKKSCLVVYTPAVPNSHQELQYFRQKEYLILKRAAVLGLLTQDYPTIAVAGTHGKTTTSSMIAHILHKAQRNPTAFLGGILQNYNSNLILGQMREEKSPMVVEADEYDKSFLHLSPQMAEITSMDADHLDIYGNKSHLRDTFMEFSKKIRMKGSLFIKKGLDLKHDIGNEPIS